MTNTTTQPASIYGPVHSWRLGLSLGVDLLCINSICSFRCIYCQLGRINKHTLRRQVFIPTRQVLQDLDNSPWQTADVITFSGSGEPTLASNLGEVITEIKALTRKPIIVLTNSTLLGSPKVRAELAGADQVFAKLDAADEETFQQINRPVAGLSLSKIIAGLIKFKKMYQGKLALQIMLQHKLLNQTEQWAGLLREILPDEVQINLPSRPVPREWQLAARGNDVQTAYQTTPLKIVPRLAVLEFTAKLRELTGLKMTLRP